MQTIIKHATRLLISLFLAGICGCGGLGGATMEMPALGVSMKIPAGWQLDNSLMSHKGDNTGLLMEEDLKGGTFQTSAGQMSREFGNTVISKSTLKISGHDAVKALIRTPAGDMLLRVYIHKGTKIIVISFAIVKSDYPAIEPALQQSIQSIKIKS